MAARFAHGHDRRKWPVISNAITQSAGGSPRQLRVGELIRHAIADMLSRGDIHDPVIEGHMITVPEVRMSADLRLATIYIMPLGGTRRGRRCSTRWKTTNATCAARSRGALT